MFILSPSINSGTCLKVTRWEKARCCGRAVLFLVAITVVALSVLGLMQAHHVGCLHDKALWMQPAIEVLHGDIGLSCALATGVALGILWMKLHKISCSIEHQVKTIYM